jgi:outer membrane protein assembly factor BamA
MRFHRLVLAALVGVWLVQGRIVAAQTTSSQGSPFEAVPEPSQPSPPKASGPIIQAIEIRGAMRLPESILRALIASRIGGAYDIETLSRDSQTLYNTGRYSAVAWETAPGPAGVIVHFVVVERSLIQFIEYQGDDTVTVPEILDRFKQRKIKLRAETLYDEDELPRAAATVQELVVERGRQNVTVTPLVEQIGPPLTVKIIFRVEAKQ